MKSPSISFVVLGAFWCRTRLLSLLSCPIVMMSLCPALPSCSWSMGGHHTWAERVGSPQGEGWRKGRVWLMDKCGIEWEENSEEIWLKKTERRRRDGVWVKRLAEGERKGVVEKRRTEEGALGVPSPPLITGGNVLQRNSWNVKTQCESCF